MGNRNATRKMAMGNGERQRQLKNKSGQLKVESGEMGNGEIYLKGVPAFFAFPRRPATPG